MKMIQNAQFKPFFWSGLIYLLLGLAIVYGFSSHGSRGAYFGWFLLFWTLSMAALATLAALVFSMVTWQGEADKARMGLRIAVLGLLKVGLLFIFGAILFLGHGIPTPSLLVGLGTLTVVPLLGGLAWSFQGKSEGAV